MPINELYPNATRGRIISKVNELAEAVNEDTADEGAGTTNLAYDADTRIFTSDTGTDVTFPLVTSTAAGLAPLSGGGTANYLRADGTWAAPAGTIYDVALSFAATPTSSEVVDRFVPPRGITFPANFAGSVGVIGTNPGSSMVLSVKAGATEIGTITISTGGSFTFATASGAAQTVAAGTLLSLVGPSSAVTSAANMACTLLASTP